MTQMRLQQQTQNAHHRQCRGARRPTLHDLRFALGDGGPLGAIRKLGWQGMLRCVATQLGAAFRCRADVARRHCACRRGWGGGLLLATTHSVLQSYLFPKA
jgi:hypothetical protein